MKNLIFGMTFLLLMSGSILKADLLKEGFAVKAGYSSDIYECKVTSLYGKMITLKTNQFIKSGSQKIQREFSILVGDVKGVHVVYDEKYPEADDAKYPKLFKGVFVEALHPNGEWYVGVILERYGKFFKISMGGSGWSPVWVEADNVVKELKIQNDIEFKDFRKRKVGVLKKDGSLYNQQDKLIAKIYSNGKVYSDTGVYIGKINADASIEKGPSVAFKATIKHNNGILYLNRKDEPVFVIRYLHARLYLPGKPERVDVFFNQSELKGHMRICGGLVLLLKDKF